MRKKGKSNKKNNLEKLSDTLYKDRLSNICLKEERVLLYEEVNHTINYFKWEQQCLII